MENKETLQKLLKNEDFLAEILELQTPEEVKSKFSEKGVDLTVPEIQQLGDIINYTLERGKTELTSEDLENIAGGIDGYGSKQMKISIVDTIVKTVTATCMSLVLIPIVGTAKWGTDRLVNYLDDKFSNNTGYDL